MMLGLLLGRAGVRVVILEKHGDFLRDFRGDTIHPSTMEIMRELGLLDEFLRQPHEATRQLHAFVGYEEFPVADFSHLPLRTKFLAFMPQWDFLNFLARQASRYPSFQLLMNAEVNGVIEGGGRIAGVKADSRDGPFEVRAALTIAADGRNSTLRACAGLPVRHIGAPIDVLWFRLPRRSDDPAITAGRFDRGRILILIYRGDYWQCGFVIPKGGHDVLRQRGIEHFRNEVRGVAPFLADRVGGLVGWEDIKLLTVVVNRLRRWHRPGLLCIGDAAHAMSPVGGVGINLAIQDAVAAANVLARPLREGRISGAHLAAVQRRRMFPTWLTQCLQVLVQNRVLGRVLVARGPLLPPWPLRALRRFPILQRLPARLIGIGVRPEHVRTSNLATPRESA